MTATFFARPMEPDDLDSLGSWLLDLDDLALFDRSLTVTPGRTAIREMWESELAGGRTPTACWFTVVTNERAPVAVGGLSSVKYAHGDAMLAMFVSKPARGKGLGLHFGSLLLDIAFDRLRLRRLTTFFRSDNERTERLVMHLGFRDEGRMREAWFAKGRAFDAVVVGVLRDEWYANRLALQAKIGCDQRIKLGAVEEHTP
ncbi:GNAT family protein [Aurantimonas sp. A2-1-M11]|uniref:GNAT family N-acetyltransferase n=1 Tax=Aurantimonas sp. A2-1-M11 TaxID=3113712 RepID=UPI002F944EBE